MAMMAMTTSNSINVNPVRRLFILFLANIACHKLNPPNRRSHGGAGIVHPNQLMA